ncbi:unnamed protein product [Arabis nemorensis]|uniref:Uncharacterized protein n=1 Tax=Arabis nemorensis TaxID=586526 RepID=A0A565BT66_9BRAS|nr:unnamed protein product [Arabis nemorensis]
MVMWHLEPIKQTSGCEQLEQMEQSAGHKVEATEFNNEQMGEYARYKEKFTQAYKKLWEVCRGKGGSYTSHHQRYGRT